MADFCKQCSIDTFGKDGKDLANIGVKAGDLKAGEGYVVLCEGCGNALVLDDGTCISKYCIKKHG